MVVDDPDSPDSLMPDAITGEGEEVALNALLQPIFFNQTTQSFIPVLASSWSAAADGQTYTMVFRNDIYFSNGNPYNAYVVWWNVYRGLYENQGAGFVFNLMFNESGVTLGDLNSFNVSTNVPTNTTLLSIMENSSNSVTVLNASAVQFNLYSPYVPFFQTMPTGFAWAFVDPYLQEQHGGVIPNQWNPYMVIHASDVGTGPYVVQQYVQNAYTVLEANPNYWAQNMTGNFILHPARIQQITINYKTNELTRALDLQSGKADAAVIDFNDVNTTVQATNNLVVPNWGPGGTPEFIMLDTEKAPLNNTLVRRAIVAAINVSEIRQSVFNGYTVPVIGPDLHGFFGYNNSIQAPAYNVTLAEQYLTQAGFPGGKGLPTLTYEISVSTYETAVAQIIIADLNAVGINVNLVVATSATFIANTESCCGNSTSFPDITAGSWVFFPDFAGYSYLVDQQLGAWYYLNNETIHNLIIQSNGELNSTLRAIQISQVTEDVLQESATIWLGQDYDLIPTGNGIGPIVWNKCVTFDSTLYGNNPYYWILSGIYYSAITSVC
jgi:ABC-type transport system substrate-binding protein